MKAYIHYKEITEALATPPADDDGGEAYWRAQLALHRHEIAALRAENERLTRERAECERQYQERVARVAELEQARHVLAGNVERLQGTGQKLAAAEAELAALKGRKVTLPQRFERNGDDIYPESDGYWIAHHDTVSAIRAAGYEVADAR
jgi:hypothetical protein